jgi:hypothetical protein
VRVSSAIVEQARRVLGAQRELEELAKSPARSLSRHFQAGHHPDGRTVSLAEIAPALTRPIRT